MPGTHALNTCGRRSRVRSARSLAIGRWASQQCWGVTAGKVSHNSSNVRGVTAGKVGRNSSIISVVMVCTVVCFMYCVLYSMGHCP